MFTKAKRTGATALFIAMFAMVLPAQVDYRINGDSTGPIPVGIGADVILEVIGNPGSTIALFVGIENTSIATEFGTLGIDPIVPSSFFLLNGLAYPNAGHWVGATGVTPLLATPFATGSVGQRCWSQALIEDPTHPEGFRLTSTIECVAVNPAPQITRTFPNYAQAGGTLDIDGKYFDSNPTANQVWIGNQPCTVISAHANRLTVALPQDAISGAITVTTATGTVGGNRGNVATWCSVLTAPIPETASATVTHRNPINAVTGRLGFATEADRYVLRVPQGQEIYAEAYSFNPISGLITEWNNPVNVRFDPMLRVWRNGMLLSEDNDSGPERAAGIGLEGGRAWLMADVAGDYEIEISSFGQLSFGNYLLVFGHRSPSASMPVSVTQLMPNLARRGDPVIVFGSGIFASEGIQNYGVTVDGVQANILAIADGRLDIEVPQAAISGQVQITRGVQNSGHGANRMASWLTISENTFLHEGAASLMTLSAPVTIFGDLQPGDLNDNYTFTGVAGQSYRIEAYSWDPARSQVTTGIYTMRFPIDTELTVSQENGAGGALSADGGGGPAANAMIGGTIVPPFTPSVSGTYVVTVRSYFNFSTGPYILNIIPL